MRVLTISHSTDDKILSFGEGELIGYRVPGDDPDIPKPVGYVASLQGLGRPNPLIKLDNGKYVWGCECWWGPVSTMKKKIAGKRIVEIDIDKVRKNIRGK